MVDRDHRFKAGDSIRITDGPFKRLVGSVELVDAERGKIRVLVIMARGATPVELDVLQVERF